MILAIDPSINNIGVAIRRKKFDWEIATLHVPKFDSLSETLFFIGKKLNKDFCCGDVPEELIVEYPEFHAATQKGAVAAVKGTTFALAAIAGYLGAYYRLLPQQMFFYTASKWKGQIPKDGMMYRFEKRFGFKAKNDHEAEAALLLDYHLKETNRNED